MTPSLRLAARAALLLVAVLLLGASFAPGLALAQEEQPEGPPPVTVTLTAEGITPEFIEVPVGGSVLFVNDDTEPHQVTSTFEDGKSTDWQYDSGVLAPKDGETRASNQTPAFEVAGRYTFNDRRGLLLTASDRPDELNVLPPPPPAVPAEPAPAGDPSAQPSSGPSGEPAPGPSGAAPGSSPGASPGAPGATGGTGTTTPLPLGGGFGSFGSTPQPIPGLDPLAPAIAPPLELAAPATTLLPDVAPSASSETRTPGIAALPTGSLPGAVTDRDFGLPAALATVTLLGVVSLLVRVLLAEPLPGREGPGGLVPRPVTVTA